MHTTDLNVVVVIVLVTAFKSRLAFLKGTKIHWMSFFVVAVIEMRRGRSHWLVLEVLFPTVNFHLKVIFLFSVT